MEVWRYGGMEVHAFLGFLGGARETPRTDPKQD